MSESEKAQSLLGMLLRLERQTSKYCSPEDLAKLETVLLKMEFPKCDLPENRFDPSMKRMLYLTELLDLGSEYSYYIMNMYQSLRRNNKESQENRPNLSQDSENDTANGNGRSEEGGTSDDIGGSETHARTKERRFTMSTEVRQFLEDVFAKQPCPNRKDRELIAKKCGITKLQVRVWFTNKRMRSKPRLSRPKSKDD